MAAKTTNSANYPSVSWSNTLDLQRSALRWDVKRAMKSLCSKLEEIGEECFVVTVNVSNGWVGHLGTIRGDEYIDGKSNILYDFLNYCAESLRDDECEDKAENQNSDTETDDVTDKHAENDDKLIQISRPGPQTDASNTDNHVILNTPVQYLDKLPILNQLPANAQPERFIIVHPDGLPIIPKTVTIGNHTGQTRILTGEPTAKGENSNSTAGHDAGKARTRKQNLEDIGSHKERYSSTSKKTNGAENIIDDQNVEDNVQNEEDSESVGSTALSDVSDSDRVLRSASGQGKKTDWNMLLRKRVASNENNSGSEENVWSDVEEDVNTDDVDDEDWAETVEGRDPWLCESKRRKSKTKAVATLDVADKTIENESVEADLETIHTDDVNLDQDSICTSAALPEQVTHDDSIKERIESEVSKDETINKSEDSLLEDQKSETPLSTRGKSGKRKTRSHSQKKRKH